MDDDRAFGATYALDRAHMQQVFYADQLNRATLLRFQPKYARKLRKVFVYRNYPFEYIAVSIRPFLAYAGYQADFILSEYDDSLQVREVADVDAFLFAIDFSRYQYMNDQELADWFAARIDALRSATSAPILFLDMTVFSNSLDQAISRATALIPDVYFCDVHEIKNQLDEKFFDERGAESAATNWSNQAMLHVARRIGLSWLPALFENNVKAIVLDLDNTLYEGVLGEDGLDGVKVTSHHIELYAMLTALHQKGMLFVVVSKNAREDVEALFRQRRELRDLPKILSKIFANWEPKSVNIAHAADALRIDVKAMLFVDDNPSELAEVTANLSGVRTLLATSPEITMRGLAFEPGMFRFTHSREDTLRAADLSLAETRETEMNKATDPMAYLQSLQIELEYHCNQHEELSRLAELARKTNQFNMSLARTSESEILQSIRDESAHAVSISLRDRLSDSGIVGFVLGVERDSVLFLREVAISCRALGRDLEDLMIFGAIVKMCGGSVPPTIEIPWTPGPRNEPALRWLQRWASNGVGESYASIAWDEDLLDEVFTNTFVTLNDLVWTRR